MFRKYICFEFRVEQLVNFLCVTIDLPLKFQVIRLLMKCQFFFLEKHSYFISYFMEGALFLKAQVIFSGSILN